jgi:uncharacterized damage-inducible protein DinB
MPSPDRYRRRFRYHTWATGQLAGALDDTEAHERARAYLAHAATADRVWLLRLRGEPTDGVALWPTLPPDGVRSLARLNADAWAAFLAGIDGRGLARTAAYTNTRGEAFETVVGDVLDHVLLHGAYHRGQAAAALRAAGTAPAGTDFIVWVRAGEPDA